MKTTRPHANLRSATAPIPVSVKKEDAEDTSVHALVKQEDTFSHSVGTQVEMPHSSSPSNDAKPVIKGEAFLSVC